MSNGVAGSGLSIDMDSLLERTEMAGSGLSFDRDGSEGDCRVESFVPVWLVEWGGSNWYVEGIGLAWLVG